MRARKDAEKKIEQKLARKDAFLKLGMIFLGVLLVADTIQIARFGEIVERVDTYNKGVVDELGGFRQDIVSFGGDINEMRSFLLLPTKTYSFMEQDAALEETSGQPEASETEKALYQYMTSYIENENAQEKAAASKEIITGLSTDTALSEDLAKSNLQVGKLETNEFTSTFKISDETDTLFAVVADLKTGDIKIQSAAGDYLLTGEDESALQKEISGYAAANKEKVIGLKKTIEDGRAYLLGLADDEEIKSILAGKKMAFSDAAEEDGESIKYNFINSEELPLMTVAISRKDGALMIGTESYGDRDAFRKALVEELGKLDGATAIEKLINDRRAELEKVIGEDAFAELLKTNNLRVSAEPREEYNKLLYDVTDEAGNVQFSFVIELSSGYFKVLRDNEEIDLYSALQDGSKKNS